MLHYKKKDTLKDVKININGEDAYQRRGIIKSNKINISNNCSGCSVTKGDSIKVIITWDNSLKETLTLYKK
ncbi:hypothetical protein BIV59_22200 [Bacillus sp. MUM 13]|nr:hypothetical protein BIV59_22200 [Bacillus sp. MUM 13]